MTYKEGDVLVCPTDPSKTYTIGQRGRRAAWVQEMLGGPVKKATKKTTRKPRSDKGKVRSNKKVSDTPNREPRKMSPRAEQVMDKFEKTYGELKWEKATKKTKLRNCSYLLECGFAGAVGDECYWTPPTGTKFAIIAQLD
jgi:hypothetical protein